VNPHAPRTQIERKDVPSERCRHIEAVAPNCLKPPVTPSGFHVGRRHLAKLALHFPSYDPDVSPSPLTTDRVPKVIVEVTVPAAIPPAASAELGASVCSSSN